MAGQRKRIPVAQKAGTVTVDNLEWVKNKTSDKARLHKAVENSETIEIWYDKHYWDRYQHGDNSGKRAGIDPEVVESLLRKTIKHLSCYATVVEKFQYVCNFMTDLRPLHPLRTVCKERVGEGVLNVVFECHLTSLGRYELTIITAMREDDFKIHDNQYVIEFDGDSSTLFIMKQNNLTEIHTI